MHSLSFFISIQLDFDNLCNYFNILFT